MMRHAKRVLSVLCLVMTGWFGTAEAFDAYLFIPGFQGESVDRGHEKWINLYQVSWGLTQNTVPSSTAAAGAGAFKTQFNHVSVQKLLDSASPALAIAVATGQHLPSAIIELVKAGVGGIPMSFARLELADVSIADYEANGAAGGQTLRPVESIKLNFSKIVWIYIPQDPKGGAGAPIRGGWDLRANTLLP